MDTARYLQLLADYFNHTGAECHIETNGVSTPILMMSYEDMPLFEGAAPIPVVMTAFFHNPSESFFDQMDLEMFRISFYLTRVKDTVRADELRRFFAMLNARLPVGAYEVEQDGAVFFAAGLPLPSEMEETIFARQAAGAYAVMRLYNSFTSAHCFKVAEGELSAEEAYERLGATITLIHASIRKSVEEQGK